MTETPVHVRATARVGAALPRAAGTATVVPRRRPGHLGPFHVIQLMLVEVAIVAILLALGRGPVALIAGVLVGPLLLIVTLGRRRGRWWLERQMMSWQFRRRSRAQPQHQLGDPRLAAMRFLAPGLIVEDVAAPDGSQIGVAADDAGWYAVAALPAAGTLHDDTQPPVPLDVLVSALAEADPSGRAVLQVVTHTVPPPELGGAAGESYRAVVRRHDPVSIPADRAIWIAVRLDARALAEMGAELPEQAPIMVAALMRHLVKTLRRRTITARALDREALLDALDRSCDLATPTGAAPVHPYEDWNAWRSGRLAHRTYWLADWPPVAQAGALLDRLATAPAVLTSIAVILAPSGGEVDIRCLARIATTPDRLASAGAAMRERAHLAHARLLELDGEQGPAVYATAPTGGGPR